jgi:hypothetical protein
MKDCVCTILKLAREKAKNDLKKMIRPLSVISELETWKDWKFVDLFPLFSLFELIESSNKIYISLVSMKPGIKRNTLMNI